MEAARSMRMESFSRLWGIEANRERERQRDRWTETDKQR